MKKSYLTVFLFVAVFCACSKSDSNNTVPSNYKIDGVHDITLQPNVTASAGLQLKVSYQGKIQERVSLSLEGVPAGCGADIAVAQGYPEFSTTIHFSDTSATPGNYDVILVCEGSKTGKSSYHLNVEILEAPDYGARYIGTYGQTSNQCSSSSTLYTMTITAGNKVNEILLNNFDNAGTNLYATVENYGQSLTIPRQTVNGITYFGNTYLVYGPSNFIISYTKSSSGGSESCYLSVSK